MARGWESKSVEDQQATANEPAPQDLNSRKGQDQNSRARNLLQLSRASILQKLETAENPRYREQLTRALEDLDKRIAALPPAS
jgi:hypothetical protein